MEKSKIMVVGSLNMDLTATTHILPNEGETVFGDKLTSAPGGKGLNQACQLGLLGAEIKMIGAIGNDVNGKSLLSALKDANVNTSGVITKNNTSTGSAVILLEVDDAGNGANRIIVIPGANKAFTYDDINFIESEIKQYDIVMLQLEIDMDVNEKVASLAHKNGIKVMLNPAPYVPLSEKLLRNIDFLSPNEHELYAMTNIDVHDDKGQIDVNRIEAAYDMLAKKGLNSLLITLGDKGSYYIDKLNSIYVPAIPTIAVDTTAAGDSFVSSFCFALANKYNIEAAMHFATRVASYTVSHLGASSSLPRLEEIEK